MKRFLILLAMFLLAFAMTVPAYAHGPVFRSFAFRRGFNQGVRAAQFNGAYAAPLGFRAGFRAPLGYGYPVQTFIAPQALNFNGGCGGGTQTLIFGY